MENLLLFVGTVLFYLVIWWAMSVVTSCWGISGWAKRVAILAILCVPLNINGNVWTIMGNAVSEKSVYSVFSFYQKAGVDAKTIFTILGYQEAGGDAGILIGLGGYQEAGNDALTVLGVAGYQEAGGDAMVGLGLAGYQEASNDAFTFFGLAGYQEAEGTAQVAIGLAFYQKVAGKGRAFGALTALTNN